ncbi:hypothetical protein [Lichenifustis flavocetrariae]|uniref:Uncharacterized protein n=1 Tax=Lichenifustis flavocetrariae TaxID=2949735 RepID=A0AA41Z2Q6_9HYPH|nr:hypothetical protein [Lichenifustis flavocetrariae]MCW6513124.1 hypothetical protein [Lichenifustis flavocetrariae]
MDDYVSRLMENNQRAELARQNLILQRRRRDDWNNRVEAARMKARDIMAPVLTMPRSDNVDTVLVLWAVLRHAAGTLALLKLKEPADLTIRRLGMEMKSEPIIF